MSVAADTRAAVDERPFLLEALRAGIVNYSAAARALDISDDDEAVATALRRYAERLPDRMVEPRRVRVRMQSGLEPAEGDGALLSVNGHGFEPGTGRLTVVVATGDVDSNALHHVLGRLGTAGVGPVAAGVAGETLCVVVERRDGPRALEMVEAALAAVPDPTV